MDAMKITIEPTDHGSDGPVGVTRITMETDSDYVRADVFFDIVAKACIAYGWHPDAVAKRINIAKGSDCDIAMNYPKMQ